MTESIFSHKAKSVKKQGFSSKELTRLAALQIIYAKDFNGYNVEENLENYINTEMWKSNFEDFIGEVYIANLDLELLQFLVKGCLNNLTEIEEFIVNNIENKTKFTYAPLLLKLIVYMAIFELFGSNTHANIIISQYINMATMYFDELQVSFINAVLDHFAKINKQAIKIIIFG